MDGYACRVSIQDSHTGPAPAPKVEHFQDCDDLALGRYVRNRAQMARSATDLNETDLGVLVRGATEGWLDRVLGKFRAGCQCAHIRAAAINTQIDRLIKVRRVARNTGDELAFARYTQEIARLRDEQVAIREAGRTVGATS